MNGVTIKRDYKSFDVVLVLMVVVLAVFGIGVIGSATRIDINGLKDSEFVKQIIWLATGLVIMLAAAFIDYHFICKFYIPIYLLNIIILAALFFASNRSRDVNRWFELFGQSIQPSEFSKIFMIIFLSKFIDKNNERINHPLVFCGLIALVALPVVLIFLQPSLSAAAIVLVVSAVIIFSGDVSYKNIFFVLVLILPIVSFLYVDFTSEERVFISKILKSYQIEKIELAINPNIDPDKYKQILSSIRAIGGGMLTGKGMFSGEVREFAFHNDFIFAVLAEEFGFIGCTAVIVFIFLIVVKCFIIAGKACDMNGRLIASGVGAMLFFQTFFHIGVATGILPNTGVNLPFVSYGGSSMWACMIAVGLVLNVGMSKTKSMFEE